MSQPVVLRAADYPRMPWKNGGGSTEEITRDAGEGLEGFGWRLSIADIGESGGFSRFDGYQRVISVLPGCRHGPDRGWRRAAWFIAAAAVCVQR